MSKEFYYGLAIGLAGIILTVLQMMYPVIPHVVGWPLVGVLAVVAFICLDIAIRRKEYERISGVGYRETTESAETRTVTPEPQEGSLDTVTGEDRRFIVSLCLEMAIQHGHIDFNGLLADRASGVPLNQLMSKECSVCGIARNLRSDRWERQS